MRVSLRISREWMTSRRSSDDLPRFRRLRHSDRNVSSRWPRFSFSFVLFSHFYYHFVKLCLGLGRKQQQPKRPTAFSLFVTNSPLIISFCFSFVLLTCDRRSAPKRCGCWNTLQLIKSFRRRDESSFTVIKTSEFLNKRNGGVH